jgi:omega-6 fatty acid desaturase (delta-12 desaturase)
MDRVETHFANTTFDAASPPKATDAWPLRLRPYQNVNPRRAVVEIFITAIPFGVVWVSMLLALRFGQPWLLAVLVLPASLLLVRLFMIQHDCGHGAFFRSKSTNDWIGRAISVLTLAPYDLWRRSHAIHHATSGNLDRRGIGDIDTITVAEYRARSWWGRMRYRVYRNPIVLFGLGPIYYFMLQNRLPIGFMRTGWKPWMSAMTTNLAVASLSGLAIYAVGFKTFALIQIPIWILASAIGVWLFYVQHQFESTFWARQNNWDVREAALHGSSHYDLPTVLRWFTANIGMHHVHHLSGRIPYYRLPEVLRDYPELKDVSRLTLLESLRSVFLTLWDEDAQRLIGFKALYGAK